MASNKVKTRPKLTFLGVSSALEFGVCPCISLEQAVADPEERYSGTTNPANDVMGLWRMMRASHATSSFP